MDDHQYTTSCIFNDVQCYLTNTGGSKKHVKESVDFTDGHAIELTTSLSSKSDNESGAERSKSRVNSLRNSFVVNSTNTSLALMAQYSDISALFDMNLRNNLNIMPKLVHYVRSVFLEIVKANYWYDIQRGVLPRLSYAATYLLYTVEVGLDKVEEEGEFGTADWRVLFESVCRMPFYLRAWSYCEQMFAASKFRLDCGLSPYFLSKREAMVEKRNVYMLTSFISAHELAQNKLHEFLMIDTIGNHIITTISIFLYIMNHHIYLSYLFIFLYHIYLSIYVNLTTIGMSITERSYMAASTPEELKVICELRMDTCD